MASIRRETLIDCSPEHAWEALRDFGAIHVRLAPGFVTDARLDGPDRIVTFFTGTVLREVLVDRDDDARRLAWSIVDQPYTHHNGVAQVFDGPDGRTGFVWVTDLLPNEIAERTAAMMDRGLAVIKETLEGVVAASST
jgi:Polyketide cyclase / dehydrase and lipid transport